MSNIDLDNLIRLVEVRPILWDRTVEGYRNHRLTRLAWQEIYCSLYPGYNTLDEQQKAEIGKIITGKWTQSRDVWHKGLKKRRELNEPEPLQGSKEAIRYERMKFLLKVYCQKEDLEQADQNQSGDFQFGEFQAGEWVHLLPSPVAPSEEDTLPNFRLKNPIHDEEPPETPTSHHQMVKEEIQVSPPIQRKKHKLDQLSGRKVKKTKIEHKAGSGANRSKSLPRKHPSIRKPSTSGSMSSFISKTETINTDEQLVSFEPKPLLKQEDLPSSSNDQVENKSILTRQVDFWGNDEMSTFLRSLKPRIESFDEVQYMDFQMGVLHLIKNIKYPEI